MAGLGLRLAWLQLADHAHLAEAAVAQRAETVPLSPGRGRILDRHGVFLSQSRLTYRVAVYPDFLPPGSPARQALEKALGLGRGDLDARLGAGSAPVFVAEGLDPARAVAVERLGLEGVAVVAGEERYGPGALARHVVGYVAGPAGGGRDPRGSGPAGAGDGLEWAWDVFLAGRGPELLALFVDGRGQPLRELGWRKLYRAGGPSSPWTSLPCDLVTTIDAGIQRVVEEVMDRRVPRGAVVVMDPRSGEVLAMASRPEYRQDALAGYLERADGCLVNRALAAYPPGSVFKPFILAAALETGTAEPGERQVCTGTVAAGGREVACVARAQGGHGSLTLERALAVSCNVAFVRLGEELGWDRLREWVGRLGLGAATGVGLPGEQAGTLPPAPGGSAGASPPELFLGQGGLEVTPLQVALAYAAIANGGRLPAVRLAAELISPIGARASLGPASPRRVVSRFVAAGVTRALLAAVREGTGKAAAVTADVAGKTGTAETGRTDRAGAELYDGWFAGFWPAYDPRYVIVVLIEDTPVGGRAAAQAFGEILEGLRR